MPVDKRGCWGNVWPPQVPAGAKVSACGLWESLAANGGFQLSAAFAGSHESL